MLSSLSSLLSLFIFNKRLYTYFWQQLWVWSIIFNSIIFWLSDVYEKLLFTLFSITFYFLWKTYREGKNYNSVNWTVKNCSNSSPLLKVSLIYNSIFIKKYIICIFNCKITQFKLSNGMRKVWTVENVRQRISSAKNLSHWWSWKRTKDFHIFDTLKRQRWNWYPVSTEQHFYLKFNLL